MKTFSMLADAGEERALFAIRARGDMMMTKVCWLLWVASICFAFLYGEWIAALAVGTPLALGATLMCWQWRGQLITRIAIAMIFMGFSGLLIHEAHGTIEAHFSVFVLLAFLLYYRDWRPVCAAAGTIAVHHYVVCDLEMRGMGIYVFPAGHPCTMVYVHAAYVVIEAAMLMYLGCAIRQEALETAAIAEFGRRLVETGVIDLRGDDSEQGASVRSTALDELLAALNVSVRQAGQVAGGMSIASGDVTAAAANILRSGHEQQASSESAVRVVRRMAQTAEDVTRNCNEVAAVAMGSVNVVEQGRETMRQTAMTIESLIATTTHVSAEMNGLHSESRRIEDIIAIMGDIAHQTDLLALNATIEAAGAGDAGRGFHVVAREIRELSMRTHASLKQAQQRVDQVREQTERVCAMTEACRTEAQLGGRQIVQANASLEQVVEQLPRIAQRAEEVVQQARAYSILGDDAVGELQGIERMIVSNSANLKRLDSLGQALQKMAGDLVESVKTFRTRAA
jgi:methyl-accepting chemotaxis protein